MEKQFFLDDRGRLVTAYRITEEAAAAHLFDGVPLPSEIHVRRIAGDRTADRRIVEFEAELRDDKNREIKLGDWLITSGPRGVISEPVMRNERFRSLFDPFDDHPVFELDRQRQHRTIRAIYDILFDPPDKNWSPDTLDAIADLFEAVRP